MSNGSDLYFRAAVGLIFFCWVALRIFFQRKVGRGEKLLRRNTRREKASYLLVSISLLPIFLYTFGGYFELGRITIPDRLRWFGALVGFAGCILFAYTHTALGKNWSGVLEIVVDHRLVTHGPYRLIRHPMYSAFFMMGIGALLLSANWIVGGINLVAVAYMYATRVREEETMMLDQFGDDYKIYMTKTGRLLPSLWR
jgi:protein-S-isoprenylcysteine O-methyltransferase Ste14